MKAPEAAMRWSDVGAGVLAVVDDAGVVPVVADDDDDNPDGPAADWSEPMESGTEATVVADVVGDSEPLPSLGCGFREQAAPPRARMSNRTRRFTGAHHRAPFRRP
jgi:hypothetical protein